MIDRTAQHSASLKALKRLGNRQIAEARQAVAKSQRMSAENWRIRGEIERTNSEVLKICRVRQRVTSLYGQVYE